MAEGRGTGEEEAEKLLVCKTDSTFLLVGCFSPATRIMENEEAGSKTDGKNDNEPRKDTDEDKEQGQNKKTGEEETRKEKGSERYSVELTVEVVVDEGSAVTMMDLLKGIQRSVGLWTGAE
ncbi:hypothetical protein NQZ68_036234 [Dissostichus eleginoides]|nr:hypothetical protein NQZ68_036234 [Dissostichus eleginoides]